MKNTEPKSKETEATLRLIAEIKISGGKPPSYEDFKRMREEQQKIDAEKLNVVREELKEMVIGCW